jgi:hypothetical protein
MIQLICCFSAWLLVLSAIWKIWNTTKTGCLYLKKIHNIPCSRCQYFTGDYRLKCTVNPIDALTEDAIRCRDFQSNLSVYKRKQDRAY